MEDQLNSLNALNITEWSDLLMYCLDDKEWDWRGRNYLWMWDLSKNFHLILCIHCSQVGFIFYFIIINNIPIPPPAKLILLKN